MPDDCCGGAPVYPYPTDVPAEWPCENYTGTTVPIPDVEVPAMAWEGFADASTILSGEITWSPPDDPATVTLCEIRPPRARQHVGFPDKCFDAPPDGSQKLDVNIRRNWRHHARMLWLSYVEPETQGPYLQSFLPNVTRGWMEPNGDSTIPGTYLAYNEDWNIVYISGTTTFQQRALQAALAVGGPENFGDYSTLPFWQVNLKGVVDRILETEMPLRTKWFIAGHSYGAALACLLAATLKIAVAEREITLFTEGSPCPGDHRLQALLYDMTQVHLQNIADPVCSMPPKGFLYDMVQWVLTPDLRNAWGNWEPSRNRANLAADGSYTWADAGSVEFNTLLTLCNLIATGGFIADFAAHGSEVYLDRCVLIS